MRVEIDTIGRRAWRKAKNDFSINWPDKWTGPSFWKDFGDTYNMQVIIDRWEHGFPVINEVEFNDEKAYMWFSLRWV